MSFEFKNVIRVAEMYIKHHCNIVQFLINLILSHQIKHSQQTKSQKKPNYFLAAKIEATGKNVLIYYVKTL